MARRSLWQRLKGAVGRFLGAESPKGVPPSEPVEPEYQAPATPIEPEYQAPEEDLYRRVPPEESGIPPGPEEDPFTQLARDMGVSHDPFASEMLWWGWFATDITPDQRSSARDQFFRYTAMDEYEFDWDQWRDWYETVSG